jgi:hypothetical protein
MEHGYDEVMLFHHIQPSRPQRRAAAAVALACAALFSPWAAAQMAAGDPAASPAGGGFAPNLGVVLDVGYATHDVALGERPQGLRLIGAEVTAESALGPWLAGRVVAATDADGSRITKRFEEAWVESTALPGGLQLRGGRFLSQIGYLNEQHPHADDFSTRPLLYRGLLGSHYFDEGVRLNWVAPTDLYWRTGLELFRGRQLTPEAARNPAFGVWTLSTKLGGDIGVEHSWQIGLSLLGNRRADSAIHQPGEEGADTAPFTGKRTWMVDGVWKWAPAGNNRQRQLRLAFELARQTGLGPGADGVANHAGYLAAAYRFLPEWSAGVRTDWLRGAQPEGSAFSPARLREHSLMLAWEPSHQQTLRLQFSWQTGAQGFDKAHAVFLQYIIAFGAHGAHSF